MSASSRGRNGFVACIFSGEAVRSPAVDSPVPPTRCFGEYPKLPNAGSHLTHRHNGSVREPDQSHTDGLLLEHARTCSRGPNYGIKMFETWIRTLSPTGARLRSGRDVIVAHDGEPPTRSGAAVPSTSVEETSLPVCGTVSRRPHTLYATNQVKPNSRRGRHSRVESCGSQTTHRCEAKSGAHHSVEPLVSAIT